MTPASAELHGVVRGGVIVLDAPAALPDGTRVTVVVPPATVPPELGDEFAAWERASDEAWAAIDDLEHPTP
ncbi:MAG TPA: hypothetical protein VGF55_30480 [Gemmataceae bacterium]|jgi:hypothetical protein